MTGNKHRIGLANVIVWSVISAAFIGPGTITTAVTAGSRYQLSLLWAIAFSTLACLMLQEISARISIVSGMSFGQALEQRFGKSVGRGLKLFIGGSVIAGCAAYEAGNILGAVSGINLLIPGSVRLYTVTISLFALAVLWSGRQKTIFYLMTGLVALMGIAFMVLATHTHFTTIQLLGAAVKPNFPFGADMVILGLVGTTIVPYNLFLSSGLSKGQTVPAMRLGLSISVVIGGIITAAILVAGTLIHDFTSFQGLAEEFKSKIGVLGASALGIGLFAAGISSAVTAPYAASVIASTVFEWKKSAHVKWIWGAVILTGFLFGISEIRPIPVILTVQALNGLILPLVTAYLIVIVNDPKLVPVDFQHGRLYNILLLVILGAVLLIGLNNVDRAISAAFGHEPGHNLMILGLAGLTLFYVGFIVWRTRSKRSQNFQ